MKKPLLLYAVLLLALALRVPGWFTEDAKTHFQIFVPDEYQHVEIAISLMKRWDAELFSDRQAEEPSVHNPQAFGLQIGALAYIGHQFTGWRPGVSDLVLLGRVLSTFYALLLIGLIYLIGQHLFHSRQAALLGALLMAIFDLNITSSHYAIPAVAYAFWTYASVFMLILFYERFVGRRPDGKPSWSLALAIPLATAQAFAVKFDFLPIAMAVAILLILVTRKKLDLRSGVGYAGSFFAFFVLFFYLTTFFDFSWAEVRESFAVLGRENLHAVAGDQHWIFNPVVYLAGVTSGTSVLVMIVFFIALISLFGRGKAFLGHIALRWWLFFLFMEFVVLWAMDAPFVRRAHIFLPFIATLSGRGLAGILSGDPERPSWQRYGATVLVILYTAILAVASQTNAWMDTRYQARQYLKTGQGRGAIHFSPFAYVPGMPEGVSLEEADILVLHETFYSRYWKSFTTPFEYPPECCAGVYHCRSETECRFYQELLSGNSSDFQLQASFLTREWLPERSLFKNLFGTYETYLGDVKIYLRKE